MKYFELTFRFDNQDESMTRFDGLPVQELADFLSALNKAVSNKNHLVLSEIKGNCYAPVISTPNKTEFEELKTLHTEIEKGNYESLKKNEKAYFNHISKLLNKGYGLSIYDKDKNFYKNIETLSVKKHYPYFYHTNEIIGILTQIGSRNLASKNTIYVDSYATEIKINKMQEQQLKEYFKVGKIAFYITEKINKESGKVEFAELDSFEIIAEEKSFYQSIESVRNKYGDYFSKQLKS